MASKTKKIVVGCAIGCGGVILLGVILMVAFFSWINRPGELLEPVRLLGEDTAGYAEWTLRIEDPGTERFVEGLLERSTIRSRRDRGEDIRTPFPPEIEEMVFSWQERRDRQGMRKLFPLVGAWTLSPGEQPGEDHHLFSVSVKAAGNRLVFVDWILSWSFFMSDNQKELRKIPYKDELLYHLDLKDKEDFEVIVFLRGNDVFFTYDLETAKRAVDRLTSQAPRAPSPLDRLFARVPEESALRGVLSNGRGEIFRVWSRIAARVDDPEALQSVADQMEGATLEGGLVDEDTLEGQVLLLAPDEDGAARHAETALDAFRDGFALEGVDFSAEAEVEGPWIRLRFRFAGLGRFLSDLGNITRGPGIIVIDRDQDAAPAEEPPPPE